MAAVRYHRNYEAALLRFIDAPDIPIDNSATEREFQNVTKLRLNIDATALARLLEGVAHAPHEKVKPLH